uniref:U1764o n=1 Tax=Mycobacterium leprae TaxID=1769 RepID=Q49997_MYCLR|nr:u1764o [Mycobacterium leprae]
MVVSKSVTASAAHARVDAAVRQRIRLVESGTTSGWVFYTVSFAIRFWIMFDGKVFVR